MGGRRLLAILIASSMIFGSNINQVYAEELSDTVILEEVNEDIVLDNAEWTADDATDLFEDEIKTDEYNINEVEAGINDIDTFQSDIVEAEYADADVYIYRHGETYDFMDGDWYFCSRSPEKVTIKIVPGDDLYDTGISKYTIESGAKVLKSARDGVFTIVPGALFAGMESVSFKIYDRQNNVIYSAEPGIIIVEQYIITYLINDGTDEVYTENAVVGGYDFKAPIDPERDGYVFAGWYPTKECTGYEFFSGSCTTSRLNIESDMDLYAAWKVDERDSFNLQRDAFTLTNSDADFIPYGKDYEITVGDYNALVSNFKKRTDKDRIKDAKRSEWGGSCFGLASAAVLAFDGALDISKFGDGVVNISKNISTPGDVSHLIANTRGDLDVSPMESMINFYYLAQVTPYLIDIRNNCSTTNESANIKGIIEKMIMANGPVLLRIGIGGGGHAVVAYDLQQKDDGYTFHIYDNSFGNKPSDDIIVTVTDDDGTYEADVREWERLWDGEKIFLKTAITADELKKGYILDAPTNVNKGESADESGDDAYYLLHTNYNNFTIEGPQGVCAEVINGGEINDPVNPESIEKVGIEFNGCLDAPNSPVKIYEYRIPSLGDDDVYRIHDLDGYEQPDKYKTSLYSINVENGFNVDVLSTEDADICFNSIGKVNASDVSFISLSLDAIDTPWYTVSLEAAVDSKLDLEVEPNLRALDNPNGDSIIVRNNSDIDTNINITVEGDYNEITYNMIPIAKGDIGIKILDDNGKCVVKKEDGTKLIEGDDYGYSVIFDSNYGTGIPALFNIKKGALIEEPNPKPERIGYEFEGWFKDAECEQQWNFNYDVITNDTVLYAGWSVDSSNYVQVDFVYADRHRTFVVVDRNSVLDVNDVPGKGSITWYADQEGTMEWDYSTVISKYTQLFQKSDNKKTVTFISQHGTISPVSCEVDEGSKITEPHIELTDEEQKRYTFLGWYHDSRCMYKFNFEYDRIWDDDTKIYAKWAEKESDSDISITVVDAEDIVYTGSAITPKVIVTDSIYTGGVKNTYVLQEGIDYKLSYGNNKNICDINNPSIADSKKPYVAVQGIGQYRSPDKKIKYFSIKQADFALEAGNVSVDIPTTYTYNPKNNKPQKIIEKVLLNSKKLSNSLYTVNYYTDESCAQEYIVPGITGVGEYYVQLEAKKTGDVYTGILKGKSEPQKVVVVLANQNLDNAKVTVGKKLKVTKAVGSQEAISTMITSVTLGSDTYKTSGVNGEGKDNYQEFVKRFEVTGIDSNGMTVYTGNIQKLLATSGTKKLIIKALKDSGIYGTALVDITVSGNKLDKKLVKCSYGTSEGAILTSAEYTGEQLIPNIYSDRYFEGIDYTVKYYSGKNEIDESEVVDAGSYTVSVIGKGAYEGTLNYSFKITQIDLSQYYMNGKCDVTYSDNVEYGEYNYATLSVKIKGADHNLKPYDYTCVNKNNSKVYSKKDKKAIASVVITGSGNYKGTIRLDYTQVQKELNSDEIQTIVTGITKDRAGNINSAKVNVYVCNDINLISKFNIMPSTTYNVNAEDELDGTYVIKITPKDEYQNYAFVKEVKIKPGDSGEMISLTDSKKIVITYANPAQKYYYDGSTVYKPALNITDKAGNDISEDNYILCYGTNVDAGKGSITIIGRPEKGYYGTKTLEFVILPKWAQ